MMPEDDIRLILGRIEGRIDARMDAQDKTLDEIHTQVRTTNGRVTALEMARERELGASEQRDKTGTKIQWRVGVMMAGLAIVVSAAVAVIVPML